jgi:hypothetical protein
MGETGPIAENPVLATKMREAAIRLNRLLGQQSPTKRPFDSPERIPDSGPSFIGWRSRRADWLWDNPALSKRRV